MIAGYKTFLVDPQLNVAKTLLAIFGLVNTSIILIQIHCIYNGDKNKIHLVEEHKHHCDCSKTSKATSTDKFAILKESLLVAHNLNHSHSHAHHHKHSLGRGRFYSHSHDHGHSHTHDHDETHSHGGNGQDHYETHSHGEEFEHDHMHMIGTSSHTMSTADTTSQIQDFGPFEFDAEKDDYFLSKHWFESTHKHP